MFAQTTFIGPGGLGNSKLAFLTSMPSHFNFMGSHLSPPDINSPLECRDLLLLSPRTLRLVHDISPSCQSSAPNIHTRNVSAKTYSRLDKSKGVVGRLSRDTRNGDRKRGGHGNLQLTSAREHLSRWKSQQSKYLLSDSSRNVGLTAIR